MPGWPWLSRSPLSSDPAWAGAVNEGGDLCVVCTGLGPGEKTCCFCLELRRFVPEPR